MYYVITSLIEIFIVCVLYYLTKFTKLNRLNKYVVQNLMALIMSALIIGNMHIVSIDYYHIIVYPSFVLIIAVSFLFGPWSGLLTGLFTAIYRFFIAGNIYDIATYTQFTDALCLFLCGCVSAAIVQILAKKDKQMIIPSVVISLTFSIAMLFINMMLNNGTINKTLDSVLTGCLGLMIWNTVMSFLMFFVIACIYNVNNGKTLSEVFKQRGSFFGNNIFSSFQVATLVVLCILFVITFVGVRFGIDYFVKNDYTIEFKTDVKSLLDLAEKDSKEYKTNFESCLCTFANEWSYQDGYYYYITDRNCRMLNNGTWLGDSTETILKSTQDNDPEVCYTFQNSPREPRYLVCYTDYKEYRVIIVTEACNELYTLFVAISFSILLEFVEFGVLCLICYFVLKNVVGNNLAKINNSLSKITRGNLAEEVNAYDYKEFATLSDHINSTVSTLKGYIKIEANRYNEEFELARQIQTSGLPNIFPPFPSYKEIDIYAMYQPAKQVGGDFYDYYFISPNKLVMIIADVSGKGIPAAMFMMRAKTALRVFANEQQDAAKTLEAANNHLCENNDAEMFVTCWLGIVDVKTGILQHSSAGHNAPFLLKPHKNEVTELDTPRSLVLGGIDNVSYKNAEYKFDKDEKLLLYTDGISEANNPKLKLFGEERIKDCLEEHINDKPKEICEELYDDVYMFMGTAEQFDDITLLTFIYNGEVVRLTDGVYETEISVKSKIGNVTKITNRVQSILEETTYPEKYKKHVSVAIDEIYSNIVKYGYKTDDKYITVKLSVNEKSEKKTMKLSFVDVAQRFNPLDESAPDTTLDAEERQIGGLGIFMVRQMMDDVFYEYENGVNCLTIVKYY